MSCQDENKESFNIISEGKGPVLFLAGFLLVGVGAIILIITDVLSSGSQESFGIVIFVGPFPIAIGGGPNAQWLILVAILLVAVSLAYFLIFRNGKRRL